MKQFLKNKIKKFFSFFGLNLTKDNPANNPNKQISTVLNLLNINKILDIGANEGQFAINVRTSGYKGEIISFEPLTLARKKMLQLSKNDNNWEIFNQCVVGDTDGFIDFNISGNSVSSSVLSILKSHTNASPESEYVGSERVPIIKLDTIFKDIVSDNTNLFIKIDTQGYEKKVLDGAEHMLEKVSGVLCELSFIPLYENQSLWTEIIEYLNNKGFILWAIQKGFTDPTTGQSLQMDVIFLRKEKLKINN